MQTLVKFGLFLILFLGIIELTLDEVFNSSAEDEAVTVSSFKSSEDLIEEQIPSLDMQLVDKETVDGEIIETYREYEVYYDENGEVVKEVPTSNYNYIRYQDY